MAGVLNLGNKIVASNDESLIPRLLELWGFYFGTIIPYIQGVFLPLRLKWNSNKRSNTIHHEPAPDVRALALVTFRDLIVCKFIIIFDYHETKMKEFYSTIGI